MSETETEIGWRIARGELDSPQRLGGFALFALRFSGTGTAWRESLGEHVFRPPEQYLSPEMCARIAGVPVIAVHPKGALDTDAYLRTVIGAIAFGYVAGSDGVLSDTGDELWCIARINDAGAADAMGTGQFSTSPAVLFGPDDGNMTLRLQDGTSILFEGRPSTIDHLAALIDAGVWDRGGPRAGIRADSQETETVTTETVAKDSSPGEMPDKTLAALDAMQKRLDAMESRDKAREDSERRARMDAERAGWEREDAAACARDDAEEASEAAELERNGEPKEVAADKARAARRDRVKARKDAARRHDAAISTADAAARRKTDSDNLEVQARVDSVCQAWGTRAPPPMQGEATNAYRVRLMRHHQQYCTEPSFKELDLFALAASQPAVLDGIERRIYADSVAAANNPTFGPEDTLMPRSHLDADTGHRITEWRGRHTFIHFLKQPSMRATEFLTPRNRAA
jgi:hypothetical protein